MNIQVNLIVITLLLTAFIAVALVRFLWERRYLGQWIYWFALLCVAGSIWSFGYALEIQVTSLVAKIRWAKFQYVGISLAPLAWFIFALQYTGYGKWLTRKIILFLSVFPLITVLLAFTNETHLLIWQTTTLENFDAFMMLVVSYGAWFWVHSAFSYVMLFGGWALLFRAFLRFGTPYRWQSGMLLLSLLTPWIGNIFYLTGYSPIPGIDMSPLGICVTAIFLTIGIFRTRLFELVPVARRIAVENMEDALIILDHQDQVVDVNPAGMAILGYEGIVGMIGRPIEYMPHIGAELKSFIKQSSTNVIEIMIERQKTLFYYDVRVSLLMNNSGDINGRLISLRDITQRKNAESELAKRNQILEMLNKLARDTTSSLDLQAILDTTAKSITKLLNVTSAYITNYDENNDTLTVIAEYYSAEASELELISDLGVQYQFDSAFSRSFDWTQSNLNKNAKYILHVDDPEIPETVRDHLKMYDGKTICEVPLYAKGKLIGTMELWESRYKRIFTIEDMALIKAVAQQAALALYNAYLYEQALTASRLKSKLLARVNHELRTPLSVILMLSEMLSDGVYGNLSEKQTLTTKKVTKSAKYLQTLVEQLLAQAESENGTVAFENHPFSPKGLVLEIIEQKKEQANSKGIHIELNVSDDMPTVLLGDQKQIKQVMLNVVNNALKYTLEGSISVSLKTVDTTHWIMQVSDTGIGISDNDVNSVFEPFWQANHAEIESSRNGFGLGLTIAKRLVGLMDGEIKLESELEVGTTFTIMLPLLHSFEMAM